MISFKQAWKTLQRFSFPFGDRDHIYIKLLAELSQCFLILDGFQGNLGLEFRAELAPCLLCHRFSKFKCLI
jgi:hypothetical protein